jgi:hypothetical protein
MPFYIFTHPETGEERQVKMTIAEMMKKTSRVDWSLEIDGVVWRRCIACEHGGHRGGRTGKAGWPMTSEAMGTHPDNVKLSIDHFKKEGVRVEYDKTGAMVFDNAAHRRKVLRAANYTDKAGYYDA